MKAIIFDFDGTVSNTLRICDYAFQSVFKEFDGRELTVEEIRKMFGPSETVIIKEDLWNIDVDRATPKCRQTLLTVITSFNSSTS